MEPVATATIKSRKRPVDATILSDPLLHRVLLFPDDNSTDASSSANNRKSRSVRIHSTIGSSSSIASNYFYHCQGLSKWKQALLRGRWPVDADFVSATAGTTQKQQEEDEKWPPEPLFTSLLAVLHGRPAATASLTSTFSPTDPVADSTHAMACLPRLVQRHPAILPTVLRSIVRIVLEFENEASKRITATTVPALDLEQKATDNGDLEDGLSSTMDAAPLDPPSAAWLSEDQQPMQSVADQLSGSFVQELEAMVTGVFALDQVFGGGDFSSVLLDTTTMTTIGTQDGIWQHSGWKQIPALQSQIASIPALRTLWKQIGRRSTANGGRNNNRFHKFAPRTYHDQGAVGAEQDDRMTRENVVGLTHSNSLSEMLPSEAVLLKSSSSSTISLRRLFWAKRVESKLLCYRLSGWADIPSVPQKQNRRPWRRTPSAPGGPIVICLDTSDSMSGRKMFLSKAVVLACVKAAHSQQRSCRVLAFSNERSVLDAGEINANDKDGIVRLLDFLSHSFAGGGTDVTGALRFAMSIVDDGGSTNTGRVRLNSRKHSGDLCANTTAGTSNGEMIGADLLLITDGEIPEPSVEIVAQLERLQLHTGLQVHGLLVGDSSNGLQAKKSALEKLCTNTHDFLVGHSFPSSVSAFKNRDVNFASNPLNTQSALSAKQPSGPKWGGSICHTKSSLLRIRTRTDSQFSTRLQAKKFDIDDEYDGNFQDRRRARRPAVSSPTSLVNAVKNSSKTADSFVFSVENALEQIENAVSLEINSMSWKATTLDEEKEADDSCWKYRDQLRDAISLVNENLVERDEESLLVVLGMVAGEHVLFLGPPGTGKSALGRRLSKLCGGPFFQRLLTRFTTPEEIFGPLSLRALENDEYKRCTEGFLPKASVAFLDEIFKANSAILNTLLTILNERQFDNGAGLRENCPIRSVIAASNELPESDELDALYDRFLLRKKVLPVSDEGIVQLLGLFTPGYSTCDDVKATNKSQDCEVIFTEGLDIVIDALSSAADKVRMSDEICFLLRDLRSFMRDDLDVDISDRRLVKASRLLKISAASHGRTQVDNIDCLLLQHIAWSLPDQRRVIKDWLWDNLTPGHGTGGGSTTSQINLLLNGLRNEALMVVRNTNGDVTGESGARESDMTVISSICAEISTLVNILQRETEKLSRHIELAGRSEIHLWLHEDEANAAQQILIPKATNALKKATRVLANARSLGFALGDGSSFTLQDEIRLSVIEELWDDQEVNGESFSLDELNIGMREAKAKYDVDTFRRWKRERKKADIK